MKKIVFIVFILFSISGFSQNSENKFSLHSADVGFGIFLFDLNAKEGGGLSLFANMTAEIHKNLFGLAYLGGTDIPIYGESLYSINELSLSYGREIKPFHWLVFQGFAGAGFYNQNSKNEGKNAGNTISFPLKFNMKFWLSQKFGMGVNSIYSINSINNYYSINLIFTLSLE